MLLSIRAAGRSPRIFQSRQQYCQAGQHLGTTLQPPWLIPNISWTIFLASSWISEVFRGSVHLQQRQNHSKIYTWTQSASVLSGSVWKVVAILPLSFSPGLDPALPRSPPSSSTTSFPQHSKQPSSFVSIQTGIMTGKTTCLTPDKVGPPHGFSPTKNGHFHYDGCKLKHPHLVGPGSTPAKLGPPQLFAPGRAKGCQLPRSHCHARTLCS